MQQIHLIGYGKQAAKPVSELRPGDVVVWNYGYKSTVLSVTNPGGTSILTVSLQSQSNGLVSERRMRASRLIAVES